MIEGEPMLANATVLMLPHSMAIWHTAVLRQAVQHVRQAQSRLGRPSGSTAQHGRPSSRPGSSTAGPAAAQHSAAQHSTAQQAQRTLP